MGPQGGRLTGRGVPVAALLAANAAFYAAFNARDVAAMAALLAGGTPVACIHPGWLPLIGREAVLEAWRALFAGPPAPQLVCENPVGLPMGEAGLVICLERMDQTVLAAANLFVREDGQWRLVHHQAGPAAVSVAPAPAARRLH